MSSKSTRKFKRIHFLVSVRGIVAKISGRARCLALIWWAYPVQYVDGAFLDRTRFQVVVHPGRYPAVHGTNN